MSAESRDTSRHTADSSTVTSASTQNVNSVASDDFSSVPISSDKQTPSAADKTGNRERKSHSSRLHRQITPHFLTKASNATKDDSQTTDLAAGIDAPSYSKLPPLKCSKYTVIGDPSLAKRRQSILRRLQESQKWRVPRLAKVGTMSRKVNLIDQRTIYSKKQDDLYETLVDEDPILPPLQCSPRVVNHRPDAHKLQEKTLVMKNYFNTGKKKQFEADRAIVPSVYSDFFECVSSNKRYLNSMFAEDQRIYSQPGGAVCQKSRYKNLNSSKKTASRNSMFCDVMGCKYCAFCIELKNRHFAWGYESHCLPAITLQPHQRGLRKKMVAPSSYPYKKSNNEPVTKLPAVRVSNME